ncbi:MAG: MauE/DoxX family redox-associated membrane protein [Candidatus Azotimanducaceae bacterium WSBS_2022_MAG_OTU7]
MLSTLPATIVTLFLSYLFVFGGCQKLSDLHSFQHALEEYKVLPASWSVLASLLIPFTEVLAGLAVLIPSVRSPALMVLAVLLAAYTAAIAINILRGRADLDCGCAGPGQKQTINAWLLGRNIVLLSMALLSASVSASVSTIAATGLLSWGFAFLGATLTVLIYHVVNQLIANNTLLRRIAHHG